MKKAFILALSIFFIFAPRVYAAHDEVTLSMHLEDELKPEKAFDIYLSVVSEYEIGCCRIGFSYSESELELKNISAENKSESDILYYSDKDGKADIIYLPDGISDIVLRFAPKGSVEKYDFEAFLYEVCDREGNYLNADTIFEFSLDTAVNTEISEKSVPEKIRVKNEVSKSYVQSSEIEVSEKESSTGYRVLHEEKAADQTTFLIFAGIAAAFAAGLAAVYKVGFRHGKHTVKKEN